MEQFSLEKYLENPSRKVVTRYGRPVRIICTDVLSHFPIVAAIKLEVGNEFIQDYDLKGRASLSKNEDYDLFFADEEEELTELQETLEEDCDFYVSLYNDGKTREELIEWIKGWCPRIIDLARKELEEEAWRNPVGAYKNGYEQGKADTLEDLPKWKKAHEHKEFPLHECVMDEDMVPFLDTEANEGDYYIELSDLKTLPKEE